MSGVRADIAVLEQIWMGNSLREWLIALWLAVCINLFVALVKWVATRHLGRIAARTPSALDDVVVAAARRTKQLLVFGVTLMIGTRYLELPPRLDATLLHIATVSGFLQLGLWLGGGLNYWINRYRVQTMSNDAGATTSLAALHFVAKLVLWTFLTLLALDNLGVNVTAMVAGLGVGGIAVALAVQNILGDLFASLSIVIDKPFVIGDVISVDAFTGSVEHVGLKTTRLRSATGEQIIFSNSDLLKTRIRNFKRMTERRMLFTFNVVYQTPPDKLAMIPDIVREILVDVPQTRFERTHFKGFGATALEFEAVYWMLTPDHLKSLDVQQRVNLALMRRLEKAEISFAFPGPPVVVQLPSSGS